MSSTTLARQAPLDVATRKAVIKIVPLIMVMYIVSYLDRVNVGFASVTMNADLGLSATAYGVGAGLFFVGYVLLEVPSNLILRRVGARRWLARIMVTWGAVASAMSLVHNEWSFYTLRVLLGIAEAGFVPGVVFFLTLWFPREVRGRVTAAFLMGIPFAVVLGAPLSAGLIQFGTETLGVQGWRFMFLAEGIPAIVLGIFVLFLLPDRPETVKWLSSEESTALNRKLAEENEFAESHGLGTVRAAFRDWRVYVVAAFGFAANIGGYALSFFLPQVITGLSETFGTQFSLMQTALITAIPYSAAAVAIWFVGRNSDRTGERMAHIAVPLALGAVAVGIALYLPSTIAVIVAISIAAAGSYAIIPIFWQLPPRFLTDAGAATGMGIIASLANVAGFISPYITGALKDATGDFKAGMWFVSGVMILAAALAAAVAKRPEFTRLPPGTQPTSKGHL